MIWRKQPEPRLGDNRVVARFAWFPTAVGAYWVWLDTYYALEQFEIRTIADSAYQKWWTIRRGLSRAEALKS